MGDNKELFLEECSEEYKPVVCLDVRQGSIIITLGGTEADVEATKTSMETEGYQSESFNINGLDSGDESSGSGVVVVVIIVLLVILLIVGGICYWAFNWQKKQEEKKQRNFNEIHEMTATQTMDAQLHSVIVKDMQEKKAGSATEKAEMGPENDGIERSNEGSTESTSENTPLDLPEEEQSPQVKRSGHRRQPTPVDEFDEAGLADQQADDFGPVTV